MARISAPLIEALRNASSKLENSPNYQWGHMGLCNCGFLAQEVTKLTKTEIHQRAMMQHGDWSEQLNDYCPNSGLPMDSIIDNLVAFGFDTDDLTHLERLSDKRILERLPMEKRNLKHNIKRDVITYFQTWISLVEEEFAHEVSLPDFSAQEVIA